MNKAQIRDLRGVQVNIALMGLRSWQASLHGAAWGKNPTCAMNEREENA